MSKAYAPLALLLLGIGLLLRSGDFRLPKLPDAPVWLTPSYWIESGPLTVCIIEETKMRSKLPDGQAAILASGSFIDVIEQSGGTFLGCIDKDVVDRDGNPPAYLVPYLAEASLKVKDYPALAYRHGNGKVTAIPLPANEPAALGALQ
jgi:hypothetical protein